MSRPKRRRREHALGSDASTPDLCAIVHMPRAKLAALATGPAWAPTIAALADGPYVDVGRVFAPCLAALAPP
ncbi:MAG TPA: hypothetical protein VGC42_11875 [Kofleriaceae bacterium]